MRRQNLNKEVAQHVRDGIFSGRIRPGERLDQDAIAETLDVSRLPVREALITLEAEGLIRIVARRGAFVARLTQQDIRDHFEMFGLLSGLAAQRAATTIGRDHLRRLEELNESLRRSDDPSEHDRLNFEFHQTINHVGASGRLTSGLAMLSNSMPTRFLEFGTETELRTRAVDEHAQIIAALRSSLEDEAAAAVVSHFKSTGHQAVEILDQRGFWDEDEPSEDEETA